MLSYLKGTLAGIDKLGNHRTWITVEVNHMGYDLQITSRFLATLPLVGETLQVYCHLQIKEDQWILFGFAQGAERDLFRQLIAVTGVGPQIALALMDTLAPEELVQAIIGSHIRLLTQAPGVGTKMAERLVLELKTKLTDWRQQVGWAIVPQGGPIAPVQEEVEVALLALGYSSSEVNTALQGIGANTALAKTSDPEAWIRAAIAWLSQ